MKNKIRLLSVAAATAISFNAFAATDSAKFDAFLDTYYAYDFNNPMPNDRMFSTFPARHNEFNVNLAQIGASLDQGSVHGRVALQAGTQVQATYATEPTNGIVTGPLLSRHIQEAYAGYRFGDGFWVDAGIFLSHIGFENYASKDNWVYSKSILRDSAPYYQSGVRATYEFSRKVTGQLHVLNGWQNISENNGNKALGMQLKYTPSSDWTFAYNNFWGNEVGRQSRVFNEVWAKYNVSSDFQLGAVFDHGLQKTTTGGWSNWWGAGISTRYKLTSDVALTGRVETFDDHDQVVISTGTSKSYVAHNASVGLDVQLQKNLAWRTELRGYTSKNSIFPTKTGTEKSDSFAVTSFSLSI